MIVRNARTALTSRTRRCVVFLIDGGVLFYTIDRSFMNTSVYMTYFKIF